MQRSSNDLNHPSNPGSLAVLRWVLCAVFLLTGPPVLADFVIANTLEVEQSSAVAYNTQTGDFLVAYLLPVTDLAGTHNELRVKRFNSSGAQQGGILYPLGSFTHEAVGRPAIAYSPNSNRFFVAVPERISSGGTYDRVIGRFLDGSGASLVGPDFLFDNKYQYPTYYPGATGFDVGSLRVTHNSLLDEFAVTFQRTIAGANQVWGQRISYTGGSIGAAVKLTDTGLNGFESHGIAYAPVAGTTPTGGRYLYTAQGTLLLLNASLEPIPVTATNPAFPDTPTSTGINIHHGEPEGNFDHFSVAYGEVEGKKRFLVIWADADNCKPGYSSCPDTERWKQWSGVWGTYIDPERLLYRDLWPGSEDNTPFPISKIWAHISNKYLHKPRIAYNPEAKSFFAAWFELPVDDPMNDTILSHIRGTYIDFFVPDELYGTLGVITEPPESQALTDVTGSCQTVWPYQCRSEQDPDLPDVAALGGNRAVAVWHQHYPPNPSDLDVWGELFSAPVPENDAKASSEEITSANTALEGSLIRATNDGAASCGSSSSAEDVWYRFTAPEAGYLDLSTCGTHDLLGEDQGMDAVISLHSPVDGGQLPGPESCNDDFPNGNFPEACLGQDLGVSRDAALSTMLAGGSEVLIRVSRYDSSHAGRFALQLNFRAEDICEGDFDHDGDVDGSDLAVFSADFGRIDCASGAACEGDIDRDGDVDGSDLAVFSADFGRIDCP